MPRLTLLENSMPPTCETRLPEYTTSVFSASSRWLAGTGSVTAFAPTTPLRSKYATPVS